nr:hypothetical protein CFP56_56626 [Quercus suber]
MEVEIAAPGRVREGGPVVVKPAEGMTERCATCEALKNIDAETLQSVDGIKEGEALESSCVDVGAKLQPFQGIQQILDSLSSLSPSFNAPNDGGVNMETENSIPISVLEADLFDIQIRESDEAVKTYGNNAKFKGFQSDVINFQSTSPDKEKSATTTMKCNEPDQSNQPLHHAIWKPPLWLILKHSAQKKTVEPSGGIAKRPRVEPTTEDVPVDPIAAVYDDDDEDEDEDDADVDVVATSPSTASPSLRSMVERVLVTQSS